MSGKSTKNLKQTIKESSSAMQSLSENIAENIRSNRFSNHLVEESNADLKMKVIPNFLLLLSFCPDLDLAQYYSHF